MVLACDGGDLQRWYLLFHSLIAITFIHLCLTALTTYSNLYGGFHHSQQVVSITAPTNRAEHLAASSSAKVQLLGDFHPDGPGLQIQDPGSVPDCKAYETSYWKVGPSAFNHNPQVYKSMRGLIKFLEAEAEAARPKKPLKLEDPTIFTVTR